MLWVAMLTLPALYIHLGLLPLIGDEAIRALVALEMMISGDYITPTLNGELYLNKPPLYNWILIGFFRLFNRTDELIIRLPTTLFLLGYCYTIYWWIRKELGRETGLLSALLFLTCGRILFWDSFLGLIDIAFSWIVFMNFMLIWHYYRQGRFTRLFVVSYLLTAFAFLLKGIPALAFQGITLVALFATQQKIRRLFTWQHVAGIVVFFLLSGSYYLFYFLGNPEYLGRLWLRLVTESTGKSAIGANLPDLLRHLFSFPFEVIYHFLPWTLLAVFFFHRKILLKAFSNKFLQYAALIFLANILVYWFSPVTYPRYLLMLVPLLFVVTLYLGRMHALLNTLHHRLIQYLVLLSMAILILGSTVLPVVFASEVPVDYLYLKALLLLAAHALVLWGVFSPRKRISLLVALGLVLLITRISFNLFLVPARQQESWLDGGKTDALRLAHGTMGKELYVLSDTITIPNAYYLTRERMEILRYREEPVVGPYFIVKDTTLYGTTFEKEFTMRVPYPSKYFYAGKFRIDQP